jgi:hypothetical protein
MMMLLVVLMVVVVTYVLLFGAFISTHCELVTKEDKK